jgi:hypothetical protein
VKEERGRPTAAAIPRGPGEGGKERGREGGRKGGREVKKKGGREGRRKGRAACTR